MNDDNQVDAAVLDCWRANYSLDKDPHDLHAFWASGAPPGAVLALRAAVLEIADLIQQLGDERRQHDVTRGDLERTRLARDQALRELGALHRSNYRDAVGRA